VITPKKSSPTITMSGSVIRTVWSVVFVTTLASEIVPLPPLAPLPFYPYVGGKALLFFILGFLTPLTFWRFNSLNYGFLFGATATAIVEISQHWIPGHTFSILELLGKWAIIFAGFALSLDARYEGQINAGFFQVLLRNKHLPAAGVSTLSDHD
jgi:hypothetical protein